VADGPTGFPVPGTDPPPTTGVVGPAGTPGAVGVGGEAGTAVTLITGMVYVPGVGTGTVTGKVGPYVRVVGAGQ